MGCCTADVSQKATSKVSYITNMAESDEADVFLDSRGSKGEADLSKNALVSGKSALIRAPPQIKG